MTNRVALYTKPPQGKSTYFRAGVPFPDGVPVKLDPAKIDEDAMRQIEADPRLKVSDAPADAVVEAGRTDEPIEPEGGMTAFRTRLGDVLVGLGEDDFTKAGTPKAAAVRAGLVEADRDFLTGELVEAVWAERKPAA